MVRKVLESDPAKVYGSIETFHKYLLAVTLEEIFFIEVVLCYFSEHVSLLPESEEATKLHEEVLENEILVDLDYHILRELTHDQ